MEKLDCPTPTPAPAPKVEMARAADVPAQPPPADASTFPKRADFIPLTPAVGQVSSPRVSAASGSSAVSDQDGKRVGNIPRWSGIPAQCEVEKWIYALEQESDERLEKRFHYLRSRLLTPK